MVNNNPKLLEQEQIVETPTPEVEVEEKEGGESEEDKEEEPVADQTDAA